MTYEAQEESLESGQPVEIYEFFVAGTFFRFANAESDQTRSGSDFVKAAISRSNIKRSGPKFETEVEVQGSLNDDAISAFLVQWSQISPEGRSTLKIYEKHLTDGGAEWKTIFAGDLQSVRFDKFQARMLCKSIGDLLTRTGPKDTWGAGCENEFGDDYCTVVLATFTKNLPLTSLAVDGITLTVNTVGDAPIVDGNFTAGYVKIAALPFDFRLIVDHVGDLLTIQQPFASISPGDQLEISQGCGHTMVADCKTRFANVENYGGTPYTPRDNPFSTSLENL